MRNSLIVLIFISVSFAQTTFKIKNVTNYKDLIRKDAFLTEPIWMEADSISFTTVEPVEGNIPKNNTIIRVVADSKTIVVAIRAYDNEPSKIVSVSKSRDSRLDMEDYVKIIFDTKLDYRSGLSFAINPTGTRYDAITTGSMHEMSDWDGLWEVYTNIDEKGWTAKLFIDINGLNYKEGLTEWGFNAERHIKRLMEKSRWTAIKRDYNAGQMIHAGRITNLPEFDYGIGTTIKVSGITKLSDKYGEKYISKLDGSLDITQKITSDIIASVTFNTDFAETEVDTRRTNLTRFPLFFPEKRSFFLEGSDILDFGFGVWFEVIPYFSRKIGLYRGETVPIVAGAKVYGTVENTSFAFLAAHTDKVDSLVPASTMGTFRIRQNIFEESNFGIFGTFGDPLANNQAYTIGLDFNFKTSHLFGNKNLNAGVWYLAANQFTNEKSSYGFKVEYPNDLINTSFGAKTVGRYFNPGLGFVPRTNIDVYYAEMELSPRPEWELLRQILFEAESKLILNSDSKKWESYTAEFQPIGLLFETGDEVSFNINYEGEQLPYSFEIYDNISILPGEYEWANYSINLHTAVKRIINGSASWRKGEFYNGDIETYSVDVNFRPSSSLELQFSFERNMVDLPNGGFETNLYGARLQFNFTPDLQLSSYIQYDDNSRQLGTNTRFRWIYSPLGELFVVYNHNINNRLNSRWVYEANQLIVKLKYGIAI